jgi:hypothetical protein
VACVLRMLPSTSTDGFFVWAQGQDPLEPFGIYDTRTANEIYEPEEGAADNTEAEGEDPSRPNSHWWARRVKEGQDRSKLEAELG